MPAANGFQQQFGNKIQQFGKTGERILWHNCLRGGRT
jgi:hypothetical protein